jgi:hypothetical protein
VGRKVAGANPAGSVDLTGAGEAHENKAALAVALGALAQLSQLGFGSGRISSARSSLG